MACLSRPAQDRRPGLATNTDFKIEKGGSDHLMARDRNISAIVWPEDRDTIFLKWLAEDAAALCDAGFSLAETRRMLAALSYVRIWSANPPWLFPIRGLPKGYRWRDGYKFSQRAGRRSNGYSYTLLPVGVNLYIKGLIAVGTKITDYPGAKIKGHLLEPPQNIPHSLPILP